MDSKNLIFTYTGKLLNVKTPFFLFLNIFSGSDEKKMLYIYNLTVYYRTEIQSPKESLRDKTQLTWKLHVCIHKFNLSVALTHSGLLRRSCMHTPALHKPGYYSAWWPISEKPGFIWASKHSDCRPTERHTKQTEQLLTAGGESRECAAAAHTSRRSGLIFCWNLL